MNRVTRQYISEVKSLFPIIGKTEKDYINSLSININDYSSEKNIKTIQELYDYYGSPNDIVNTYFSISDISEIIKRIQFCKWIRRGIIIFLTIVILSFGTLGAITYHTYQTFLKERAVFTDTTIE